jgi:hypothetical protein
MHKNQIGVNYAESYLLLYKQKYRRDDGEFGKFVCPKEKKSPLIFDLNTVKQILDEPNEGVMFDVLCSMPS